MPTETPTLKGKVGNPVPRGPTPLYNPEATLSPRDTPASTGPLTVSGLTSHTNLVWSDCPAAHRAQGGEGAVGVITAGSPAILGLAQPGRPSSPHAHKTESYLSPQINTHSPLNLTLELEKHLRPKRMSSDTTHARKSQEPPLCVRCVKTTGSL